MRIEQSAQTRAKKFVVSTGWTLFALSIAVIGLAGVQVFLMLMLFAIQPDLRDGLSAFRNDPTVPPMFRIVIGYAFEFLLASLIMGVVSLIASLAFVKMRPWSWWAMFLFAILSTLGNLWGAWFTWIAPPMDYSFLQNLFANLPLDLSVDALGLNDSSARISGVALSLFFAAGFAWMSKRLCEPEVRALFKSCPLH